MANELTYPLLPCRDLDEAIGFYEALGFTKKYRQLRPYPYGVMIREDLQIHLFGMPAFDPAQSYGSVLICVPDPDELYQAFATGLREKFGKLPVTGIPRILRPRKKFGTVYGFSVVDVGGNWLRVSKLGDEEEEETPETKLTGLAKIIDVAARLGDAHGDDATALQTLENGIKRYADAPAIERARALLFRAQLAVRVENITLAKESLEQALSLKLSAAEKKTVKSEIEHTRELVAGGS
jgi:hypothetical protein